MTDLKKHVREIPDFPIPGILFYDITTLIRNGEILRECVLRLAEKIRSWGKIDAIVAPEARGFIFAAPLAVELGAGLIPIRKPGKLPYKTVSKSYELEYGSNTVQMNIDAVNPGDKIILVDDLLATGGTIEACKTLVEESGGDVLGAAFVMELTFLNGREKLGISRVESILQYDS